MSAEIPVEYAVPPPPPEGAAVSVDGDSVKRDGGR